MVSISVLDLAVVIKFKKVFKRYLNRKKPSVKLLEVAFTLAYLFLTAKKKKSRIWD